MATVVNDTLFDMSQSFFSQDVLQKLSKEINQPVEQTRIGLKSAIPTLLMGIINKGSTKEGAEALVDLAVHQGPKEAISSDPGDIKEGNEVVNKIFGKNLNAVLYKLGDVTGMNQASLMKMLGMAAPMIMGVIGNKIKKERMSTLGFMTFLSEQKASLVNLVPSGIPGLSVLFSKEKGKSSIWPKVILALLLLWGVLWLYRSMRASAPVQPSSPAALSVTIPAVVARDNIFPISSLGSFLRDSSPGALGRFSFVNLKFKTGTIDIDRSAQQEIETIVAAMKANPESIARIEGYTDNVGQSENNKVLSEKRAQAVKDEIVFRGVRSSRIEAVGLGESSPVASNATAQGRLANRRIEFVVRK